MTPSELTYTYGRYTVTHKLGIFNETSFNIETIILPVGGKKSSYTSLGHERISTLDLREMREFLLQLAKQCICKKMLSRGIIVYVAANAEYTVMVKTVINTWYTLTPIHCIRDEYTTCSLYDLVCAMEGIAPVKEWEILQ